MEKIMEKIMVQHEVSWHPKSHKLAQIPKQGLEYAFVSEKFEQAHQLLWCKDFLQDAIYGFLNKKKVSIYNFIYDPATNPALYMDKTRVMISNWKDTEFRQKIPNLVDFLNQFEIRLRMWQTRAIEVTNPPPVYRRSGVFILDSSPRWMRSPPMISLYSLFLRVGMVHTAGDSYKDTIAKVEAGTLNGYYSKPDNYSGKTVDSEQLSGAKKGIAWLLKYRDQALFHTQIKQNYPEGIDTSEVHNNLGIGSFSYGGTSNRFPHWHRLQGKI